MQAVLVLVTILVQVLAALVAVAVAVLALAGVQMLLKQLAEQQILAAVVVVLEAVEPNMLVVLAALVT
jgi:hypothetical protein